MGGSLITMGSTVICSHGGQAVATSPNPRVTVNGVPTVLLSAQWVVAGCPLVPPPLPPCVSAQWVSGTVRVTSNGQSLVISTGVGVSIPNGTPLISAGPQGAVSAT
jgi:hypothetical protein